eukprot:NODE_589_length_6347_cov_0.345711.p5 type:complete len:104 gc:universal NODE_589_length_6347_cov_0.345711:3102-3413(+)
MLLLVTILLGLSMSQIDNHIKRFLAKQYYWCQDLSTSRDIAMVDYYRDVCKFSNSMYSEKPLIARERIPKTELDDFGKDMIKVYENSPGFKKTQELYEEYPTN